MAETVFLEGGRVEVIFGDKGDFLERLIREELGDDAARCFNEYVSSLKEETRCVTDSADEKERSADGYYAMCQDALESFGRILELLESPRLNRAALKSATQSGYDDLNSNL